MEIFLNLPTKSLLRFMCASKSWNKLICSSEFVKTHLKGSHHRVVFRDLYDNYKACCLPNLFNKEQSTAEVLFDVQTPNTPKTYLRMVDSVNGLILLTDFKDVFVWNPTLRKKKKLPKVQWMQGLHTKNKEGKRIQERYHNYGFGYDEAHDDYKVVYIQYFPNKHSYDIVVNIYSLRTDSWRIIDKFEGGGYLIRNSSRLVNGKLYWTSCDVVGRLDVSNIISLDLTNEGWAKLGLPSCRYKGQVYDLLFGTRGTDLSMLCTLGGTCDVWILKDSGVDVIWTKMLTITTFSSPTFSYFIQTEGEILLFLPPGFMIYNPKDGSSTRPHVTGFEQCYAPKIYVESLVDPFRHVNM